MESICRWRIFSFKLIVIISGVIDLSPFALRFRLKLSAKRVPVDTQLKNLRPTSSSYNEGCDSFSFFLSFCGPFRVLCSSTVRASTEESLQFQLRIVGSQWWLRLLLLVMGPNWKTKAGSSYLGLALFFQFGGTICLSRHAKVINKYVCSEYSIETTTDNRRTVGLFVPNAAVETVLQDLTWVQALDD